MRAKRSGYAAREHQMEEEGVEDEDDLEPLNAISYFDIIKIGLQFFKRGDDDAYDRLSSRITVAIHVLIVSFNTLDTLTKEPIVCHAPAEFTEQWIEYTESVCWVQNTYTDFFNADQPGVSDEARTIPYYQWVSFILLGQAVLFTLPGMFWAWAAKSSGYDLQLYSSKYRDEEGLETPEDEKSFIVDRIFASTAPKSAGKQQKYGKGALSKDLHFGCFLTIAYIFTKLLYAANAILQFSFLKALIGEKFNLYGYQALKDWLNGSSDGIGEALFPKRTRCQFDVRGPLTGSIQKMDVECVLPQNLFYEKAFIFIWWWLAFVAAITIIGLLRWLMKNAMPGSRQRFVWKYLRSLRHVSEADRTAVQTFADGGLCSDGIFCLSLILNNSSDLTTAQVVAGVWDKWNKRKRENESNQSAADK